MLLSNKVLEKTFYVTKLIMILLASVINWCPALRGQMVRIQTCVLGKLFQSLGWDKIRPHGGLGEERRKERREEMREERREEMKEERRYERKNERREEIRIEIIGFFWCQIMAYFRIYQWIKKNENKSYIYYLQLNDKIIGKFISERGIWLKKKDYINI